MVPMMFFMVVIVGAVVWGAVAIARSISAPEHGRTTAEDILNERFARGELDAAEYRDRIDVLRGARPTTTR
jgi:putative membrane protein